MKKTFLFIGFVLGLGVVLIYELTLRDISIDLKNEKLSIYSDLRKDKIESTVEQCKNQLNGFGMLISANSHFSNDEMEKIANNYFSNDCFTALHFTEYSTHDHFYYSKNQHIKSELKELVSQLPDYKGSLALKKAIDSGGMVIEYIEPQFKDLGESRLILPVFDKTKYFGVLTGFVSFSSMFSKTLSEIHDEELGIHLIDNLGRLLYGDDVPYDLSVTSKISVNGYEWFLTTGYLSSRNIYGIERRIATFSLSLLFLVFIAAIFYYSYRYFNNLEQVIDDNSIDLERIHQEMNDRIKQSKNTEKDLIRSEERYRALFDNNPIQTLVVDNNCRIVMYNFARERVVGRLPEVGTLMYKEYAEHHEVDMFSELMQCIETREQKEFPELQYKDRFLRIHISPYSEGAIITSIDITATKKLFEQLQHSNKMEAIGTLAGGIAHEFNNVIGIMLGNVEMLLDEVAGKNNLREVCWKFNQQVYELKK